MGNVCSRSANKSDPFSQPGRVLGSASTSGQTPAKASTPPRVARGPGRTLGGGTSSGDAGDARAKAAEAAQKRAEAMSAANKGKYSKQLEEQKKKTQQKTLEEASKDALAARQADQNLKARQWD
ncbi:hypothetical protein VTN49DRAFT_4372 [Thermomyces lanuginosus]|uniref:uncharacterized protein n=1 Tax=Thermomyces lanuginosus TaxID=5541 RepID=UPI0037425FB6